MRLFWANPYEPSELKGFPTLSPLKFTAGLEDIHSFLLPILSARNAPAMEDNKFRMFETPSIPVLGNVEVLILYETR